MRGLKPFSDLAAEGKSFVKRHGRPAGGRPAGGRPAGRPYKTLRECFALHKLQNEESFSLCLFEPVN
jgi:hypothetical protein